MSLMLRSHVESCESTVHWHLFLLSVSRSGLPLTAEEIITTGVMGTSRGLGTSRWQGPPSPTSEMSVVGDDR